MYLQTVFLRNVRQLGDHSFDFKPGFNLLVGENGAGKTTLLRAVMAVLGSATQTGHRSGLADEDISFRADALQVSAWLADPPTEGRSVLTYDKRLWKPARRGRGGRRPTVLLYASNESTCRSFVGRRIRRYSAPEAGDTRSSEEFLYEAERRGRARLPHVRGFGDSSQVRSFVVRILSIFSPSFAQFAWSFTPYDCSIRPPADVSTPPEPFVSIRDTLRRAIMRNVQEMRPQYPWPDQSRLVTDSKGIILEDDERQGPEVRELNLIEVARHAGVDESILGFLESCTVELRLTPRIVIQTPQGMLQLSQLSDGERRLFSLLVDIARQLSLQNGTGNPTAQAIVLIDEIDVHLHPKWQRMIVPALEDLFPACQFIATTHSPFVIQAVDRSKILRLGPQRRVPPDDNRVNTIDDIAEEIQGIDMPQRSKRSEDLSKAAERYFKLLKSDGVSPQELHEAEIAYRKASEPFTSQPALHALLKLEILENR